MKRNHFHAFFANPNKSHHKSIQNLILNGVIIASFTALLFLIIGEAINITSFWKDYQNPRETIFWEKGYNGSNVILIGDSFFCSFYVNSVKDTLWERIQELSEGRYKVFPAGLDAATPNDFISEAIWIAKNWPEETVVFIDIIPTRFIPTNTPKAKFGNYHEQFLIKHNIKQGVFGFGSKTKHYISQYVNGFFAARNPSAIRNVLGGGAIDSNPYHRDISWNSGLGAARSRYERFEKDLLFDAPPMSYEWVDKIHGILSNNGIRPVFVLTPLATDLINSYASSSEKRDGVKARLSDVHKSTLIQIQKRGYDYIDLYDACESEDFFDMVHTNARGDRVVAKHIVEWLDKSSVKSVSKRYSPGL